MKTMYKTIRHGENSLQYTILPQHDDFKSVDGKLRPASGSRNGGSGGGRKKKSLMAFIGLFFVCSIITGAILVPLMVSVEFMASPSAWFHKTTNTSSNNNVGGSGSSSSSSIKNNNISGGNIEPTAVVVVQPASKFQKLKTFSKIIKFDYPTAVATTAKTIQTTVIKPLTLAVTDTTLTTTKTTIVTTTEEPIGTIDQQPHQQTYPQVNRQRLTTTIDDFSLNKATTVITDQITNDLDMHENGEDNLLLRPPPPQLLSQKQLTTVTTENQLDTTIKIIPTTTTTGAPVKPPISSYKEESSSPVVANSPKETKNWLKSHWPIVDPSTYFQWTDYESEDNILLPAMFCLAIAAVVIFASLCVVVKNKKCCSKKRDEFLTVEAQNGDNTTLLTNEYPSDEE